MPSPFPTPDSTLAQLSAWWIEVRCDGCRTVYLPVKMLLRDGWHPSRRAAEIAVRLRCRRCQERPASVALVDSPQLGAAGYVHNGPGQQRVALPVGGES
jgi:rubredoxin